VTPEVKRVHTTRELRELMAREELEAGQHEASIRGQEAFKRLQWEAGELAARVRQVNATRDPLEWAMVLRLAAFELEKVKVRRPYHRTPKKKRKAPE
jgi:hypothetical protein